MQRPAREGALERLRRRALAETEHGDNRGSCFPVRLSEDEWRIGDEEIHVSDAQDEGGIVDQQLQPPEDRSAMVLISVFVERVAGRGQLGFAQQGGHRDLGGEHFAKYLERRKRRRSHRDHLHRSRRHYWGARIRTLILRSKV